MRQICIVRHAKAKRRDGGDFDRPLSKRGLADARTLAQNLARRGLTPDMLIASAAPRAARTAAILAAALGVGKDGAVVFRGLYGANAAMWLRRLRALGGEKSVVLVGHNPELEELAGRLAGGEIEIPPGGALLLQFSGAWKNLRAAACRLRFADYPPRYAARLPQNRRTADQMASAAAAVLPPAQRKRAAAVLPPMMKAAMAEIVVAPPKKTPAAQSPPKPAKSARAKKR